MTIAPAELEDLNAALIRCKDAAWAVAADRLRKARAVADLAGPDAVASVPAIEAFTSVQVALSAIDRLEVRGRDSAGLHLLVRGHGLDLADPAVGAAARPGVRATTSSTSGAVRTPDGLLSFVYKAAAEIGELGDNTAASARGDPRTTSCSTAPSSRTRPRSSCSATRVGRASASSPRPTPTR